MRASRALLLSAPLLLVVGCPLPRSNPRVTPRRAPCADVAALFEGPGLRTRERVEARIDSLAAQELRSPRAHRRAALACLVETWAGRLLKQGYLSRAKWLYEAALRLQPTDSRRRAHTQATRQLSSPLPRKAPPSAAPRPGSSKPATARTLMETLERLKERPAQITAERLSQLARVGDLQRKGKVAAARRLAARLLHRQERAGKGRLEPHALVGGWKAARVQPAGRFLARANRGWFAFSRRCQEHTSNQRRGDTFLVLQHLTRNLQVGIRLPSRLVRTLEFDHRGRLRVGVPRALQDSWRAGLVTPDWVHLVSVRHGHTVQVLENHSRKAIWRRTLKGQRIVSLAVDSKRKTVVVLSNKAQITWLALGDGKVLKTIGSVPAEHLAKEGRRAMTADGRVWDLERTPPRLIRRPPRAVSVTGLVFGPKGQRFAVSTSTMTGRRAVHRTAVFHRNGGSPRWLAGRASQFDASDGHLLLRLGNGYRVADLRKPALRLSGVVGGRLAALGPTGRLLAVYKDGLLRVLDVVSGGALVELPSTKPWAMRFGPRGQRLALITQRPAGRDGYLSLLHLATGRKRMLQLDVSRLAGRGSALYATGAKGWLYQWDLRSQRNIRRPRRSPTRRRLVFLEVSADGTRLLGGSRQRLWSWRRGAADKKKCFYKGSDNYSWLAMPKLALSPSGRLVAEAAPVPNARLSVWDAHTGRQVLSLFATSRGLLAITPDGFVDGPPAVRPALLWRRGSVGWPAELAWSRQQVPGLLRRVLTDDGAFRFSRLRQLLRRTRPAPADKPPRS